ncbi:hypothetical protein [Curtobacterium sp. Leaf261]|uniref:hypothetical protein n=1 Tax=Curtobacterium sp. Leaf261 TaxID=1736311 RepID=UPI0012E119C7|nr:hypothetical protein [Curtobacterium sp. Leaf261]
MLENSRNHLAERVAIAELAPHLIGGYAIAAAMIVMGVGLNIWILVDDSWVDNGTTTFGHWTAWSAYGLGLVGAVTLAVLRANWIDRHRADAYDRSGIPPLM